MAQLTDEQRLQLFDMWEGMLVDGARNRDVASARTLIGLVVGNLRRGEPLTPRRQAYLADALEQAVSNPEKAGQSLGLIGKKHRPKSSQSRDRNKKIVQILEILNSKGFPPYGNRYGRGVFLEVSKLCSVSERTVKRAWEAHVAELAELRDLIDGKKSDDLLGDISE